MTQQALFREINRALEKANDAMRKQRLSDLQRHRVLYGDLF
ncbi:ArsR family transcriptional regulator [Roseibium sp. TrichSKD4]|nr:ArsR family transcriptional regulator [Roseibium sp. TrichSKD4]